MNPTSMELFHQTKFCQTEKVTNSFAIPTMHFYRITWIVNQQFPFLETKNDVEKSVKGENKSICTGTRNQKSAVTTSNKKNNHKLNLQKFRNQLRRPSQQNKLKSKYLKSASATAKDRMKSIKWKEGSLFFDSFHQRNRLLWWFIIS